MDQRENDTEQIRNILAQIMLAAPKEISGLAKAKQGMTNISYLFRFRDRDYIFRMPGSGTEKLIQRNQEYDVYEAIKEYDITDRIIYLSATQGYKITEYWREAHTCDAHNWGQVTECMELLRRFHGFEVQVNHTFDLFERIEFYESLRKGRPSRYEDYFEIKKTIFGFREFLERQEKQWGLSHIDSVPDNFLFTEEGVKMLDWEYAGMQDQHIDVAMFAIYALYSKKEIDRLMECYFEGPPLPMVRLKIYGYVAACGLLWSNWCEYKALCGVEFGTYASAQFEYAREFCRLVKEEIESCRDRTVRNAIIMAAGKSQRFAPLSYETPKALLKVRGEVLIERQLRQLHDAGITEIVVVTGYKKELFSYLEEKFHVTLVDNPDYQDRNNHSSLYHARDFLKNTYICSADHYFVENVFQEQQVQACYAAVYQQGPTQEWCVQTNGCGEICSVTVGGADAWIMLGYAYFTEKESERMKVLLKEAYENVACAGWYWEDIYCRHLDEIRMIKKTYREDMIKEFDTLEELREFDPQYRSQSGCGIMRLLCEKLHCGEEEISGIRPVQKEGEVIGIRFLFRNTAYQFLYEGGNLYET